MRIHLLQGRDFTDADGRASSSVKHGPTALVNDQLPIVVLATQAPGPEFGYSLSPNAV